MIRHKVFLSVASLSVLGISFSLFAVISAAQFQRGLMGGRGPVANRNDYPTWTLDKGFEEDVFTFARIQYDSLQYRPGRQWDND
ncbi:hypothetical protein OAL01_03830, partial [Rubripirellula sp.]|nr:hypothetical protein [Rubripirellula sp.]